MSEINRIEETCRELTAAGREPFNLYKGNPNDEGFCFPPEILQGVYQRYLKGQEYRPDPKGLFEARRAVSDYYARQGEAVDPANILITSGTSESFFYLFSLLAKAGDNLLVPNPGYPLFDPIADLAHVELRPYKLLEEKSWGIDLEGLHQQTDAKTRAIVVVSPNNPTGAVASDGELREIAQWGNQKKIPLICDEVFSEFWFGAGNFPRGISATPNLCFTLNGISKMFALPGLKLSWIVVTGEPGRVAPAVDHLETINDTFLTCHTPIQQALPLLFSEGADFLKSYREEVRRRGRLALSSLTQIPGLQVVPPAGGFYLMAKADLKMTEEEFVIRLMKEQGLFVHPGYFYDYERGVHFVISHLTTPERLQPALGKIATFLGACR